MIKEFRLVAGGVAVTVDSRSEVFTWRWLRDHGEDSGSLDAETLQRKVDTFSIPDALGGTVELRGDRTALEITWDDGWPVTMCSGRLFEKVLGVQQAADPQPWSSPDEMAGLPTLPFGQVVGDDDALMQWLDHVSIQGFGLVSDMTPTPEAAQQLAGRIAAPRSTVFGGIWRLAAEMDEHQDSAYSTTFLEPHTDSTYFTDAPGLQLFCCEERTGTGGESILVDGLAIAETLRTVSPAAFEVLTSVTVPGRYVEPGVHYVATRPPIRLDGSGRFEQVSFNNYDRAPFWLPEPEMTSFYDAYGELHRLINDRDRWFAVRLDPGDALLFDNWRVLHGRNAYTGRRIFHGCYHNRDDYLSRLGTLR